jgi:hypothetical protein
VRYVWRVMREKRNMYLYDLDRRHADRYKVTDGKIKYRLSSGHGDVTSIRDIAQNSASFQINHSLQPGDTLELEIIIPSKDKINLKAICVRILEQAENNLSFAAVQFMPYSTIERFNSLRTQEQMRRLIEEFKKELLSIP